MKTKTMMKNMALNTVGVVLNPLLLLLRMALMLTMLLLTLPVWALSHLIRPLEKAQEWTMEPTDRLLHWTRN